MTNDGVSLDQLELANTRAADAQRDYESLLITSTRAHRNLYGELDRMRQLLQAVLDCETCHDEQGHAYLRVPARSLHDLGSVIRYALDTSRKEFP